VRDFIKNNLLMFAVTLATLLAAVAPALGLFLESFGLSKIFIIAIFVLQGLGLEVRSFKNRAELGRAAIWGTLVAHGLGPLFGYVLMRSMHWDDADRVGFILICCSTPTIVSGIVVATRAGGDAATALLLTVLVSALGILSLPLNLAWTLGAIYPIDQLALAKKLLFFILVPALVGVFARSRFPSLGGRSVGLRKHGPVVLLGLTVLASLSPFSASIRALSFMRVIGLLWPALLVHGLLLSAAYYLGRSVWRMSERATLATAFVTSQKSLPVAIAVWSGVMASQYPLAIIPPLIFHSAQIIFDTFIARFLNKAKSTDVVEA